MAKCKVCGFRLSENVAKCPMCGAEAGSTVAGEISSDLNIAKYFCPSCKAQILGEHRYCPNCGVDIKEAAKKNKETQSQNLQGNKCIKCGAVLPENAKFCNECGAKQDTEKNLKTSQLTMVSPSQNNIQKVSCNLPETPLDAFEYEEKNGFFELIRFKNESNIKEIVIPKIFVEIHSHAFQNCEGIRKVFIPESIKSLSWTFPGCTQLEMVTIPNSVTIIGSMVFSCCEKLKDVKIPDSVLEIGPTAFSGCKSLVKLIIPDSVSRIWGTAFQYCENLEEINIPNTVSIIESKTFSGCKNLKEIKIPDSVIEIESGAFSGCESLETVIIPNSVNKIGAEAFSFCKNLKKLIILGNNVTYTELIGDSDEIIYRASLGSVILGCEKLIEVQMGNTIISGTELEMEKEQVNQAYNRYLRKEKLKSVGENLLDFGKGLFGF